jgi:hypothetical protein
MRSNAVHTPEFGHDDHRGAIPYGRRFFLKSD